MRVDRLNTLADTLEKLTKKQLKMDAWVADNEGSCGFAGCALGWAAQIPEFKQDGLFIKDFGVILKTPEVYTSGYDAASQFFDISDELATEYFTPGTKVYNYKPNPLPKTVAMKLRELAAKGEDFSHYDG